MKKSTNINYFCRLLTEIFNLNSYLSIICRARLIIAWPLICHIDKHFNEVSSKRLKLSRNYVNSRPLIPLCPGPDDGLCAEAAHFSSCSVGSITGKKLSAFCVTLQKLYCDPSAFSTGGQTTWGQPYTKKFFEGHYCSNTTYCCSTKILTTAFSNNFPRTLSYYFEALLEPY